MIKNAGGQAGGQPERKISASACDGSVDLLVSEIKDVCFWMT